MYYSSKLVTVMEEIHGYDWNGFLADIGGSLGFFLGISVIGIFGIFDDFIKFICGSPKLAEEIKKKEDEFNCNSLTVSKILSDYETKSLPDYDSVVSKDGNVNVINNSRYEKQVITT